MKESATKVSLIEMNEDNMVYKSNFLPEKQRVYHQKMHSGHFTVIFQENVFIFQVKL